MSLVISDTGPVQYLILCGAIDILPKLYDRLIIPFAVAEELSHPRTPARIRSWLAARPPWVSIQTSKQIEGLPQLGLGEQQAIFLAEELKATQVLIDERVARRIALARGLLVTGTVGILEQAAARRLLNLQDTFKLLLNTNFRVDVEVIRNALERDESRRKHFP